jgi:GT2 family glycosyltransferase
MQAATRRNRASLTMLQFPSMPMSPSHPPSALSWDGLTLRLTGTGAGRCAVSIDGSRFCELEANAEGVAELRLPFSPSGEPVLGIRIDQDRIEPECEPIVASIELGRPGLQPAIPAQPSLGALVSAERPVPVEVEPMQREVAVIVPVYNAADGVARCLDSVLAHTTGPCRLIVIDDASTDPAITPLLQRYRGIADVDILANEKNLGFTATVNRGIRHAGDADVVLLNADTEVAAHWLTGLRRAACSAADVATATAVSDNAGAFSVPELERENPLPAGWTFAQTARALWQSAGHAYPQLPTGNGFCMYIRREVLDEVGLFDVEAFPQGYGEENDFCQRASARGYRHLLAGNVFVAHARSQSFGIERREQLGRAGMQVLRERWPNYEADVGAMLFSFERRVLDWRVRRIHAMAPRLPPLPRVLHLHAGENPPLQSGYDNWMITMHNKEWVLHGAHAQSLETAAAGPLASRHVSEWLQRYGFEWVAFGDRVEPGAAKLLAAQAHRLGIPVLDAVAHLHDGRDAAATAINPLRSFNGEPA